MTTSVNDTDNKEIGMTDYTDERMADLRKQMVDAERKATLAEAQTDYHKRIVQVFARMLEYMGDDYDTSEWLDAVHSCNTMSEGEIIDLLISYKVANEDVFKREFMVTVTVPVTVCVNVMAMNADQAEEAAKDQLDYNGLFDYDPEYDIHYNAEIYDVQEA
jgi:hypothetical protein